MSFYDILCRNHDNQRDIQEPDMPVKEDPSPADSQAMLPNCIPDDPNCMNSCMARCLNCRREVEASMSRIAGRGLRRARKSDECSVARCVAFLRGVKEEGMRLHFASMAWWRFSADNDGAGAPLLRIMRKSRAGMPEIGPDYMHRALVALSPLTPMQLSTWFGCDNLYQLASVFIEDRPVLTGEHCPKCWLYKNGCTAYNEIGADYCPLWRDEFVQNLARTITKAGGWKNPCNGVTDAGEEQ